MAGMTNPAESAPRCFRCEYDISGIDHASVCPECGLPVGVSVGESLLSECDPTYLRSLHSGVFLIQTAIIILMLNAMANIGANIFTGIQGAAQSPAVLWLFSIIGLAATVMLLMGWWRFSAPNPQHDGGRYDGGEARRYVRVLLFVALVIAVLQLITLFLPPVGLVGLFVVALGLIGLATGVARFFCEMYYVRWVAPLIPSRRVYRRAKLLMWLGPVLMTVGLLLIGLGPLIALVMYWNMFDWIRKDLKRIRSESPGPAGPVVSAV